ncbi:flagellar hook-associated protein 2 [Metabacillus idriensis]|uniref:flagellar hook-associated protein 2 n=1 Tax=Metabacillus idriensis TaxID=324768 RepID=UPI002813383C|nr:flagellar hook-associated protein 2 [Metabacillus idriensis]MDR0138776.1 flagellar hook-associated protein 2 [Metabacillus idriensis]
MVRIGGLASGMDIDSLVADLMKAERMPLDKLKQNKQTLEWQRDGYREMNSLLFAFRNATFDMKLSSNYRARSTNSSNSEKVTATATSSASTSSYSISKVDQLASAATKVNAGAISASGSKVDPSKSLYEIKDSFANQNFNWQTGTVKNQTITAAADGSSLKLTLESGEVLKNFDKDAVVKVDGKSFTLVTGTPQAGEVQLDSNGNLTFLETVKKGSTVKVDYVIDSTDNYMSFDMQTHTSKGQIKENFLIQGTESLNTVFNKINSSQLGVTALYDSFSDKITLTRKETGDFNTAGNEIITSAGFLNNVLRFGSGTETGGQNAKFTVNGLSTERTSNTFEMSGVTFTLKDTFTAADPAVSINVTNDTNAVFDNIKKFVTLYNETIAKIQGKTDETRYRDYQPLSDEERESLTDKQQEQWDEKAQSGLLRKDSILTGALSQMRSDFYSTLSAASGSSFTHLSNIGISTTSNYREGGKLIIDEAKLKKAIEENPEGVEKLFTSNGPTSGEKGIITNLYDNLKTTMDKLNAKAGTSSSTSQQFTIGRNLSSIDNQINRFEDRLTQVEDRYWAQFTAMEKAIQRSNDQMNYLMQQFG